MNTISLTFDTDWCPQYMIDDIILLLEKYQINESTFFVTDDLPSIPLKYEIGLHPNLEDKNFSDIEDSIKKLIEIAEKKYKKDFTGIRTHRLYSHSLLNLILDKLNFTYQSNYVCFLQDNLTSFLGLNKIYEIPMFFMDYYLMDRYGYVEKYNSIKDKFYSKGLKVLDFHPIHIFMNTPSLDYYIKHKNDFKINKKEYGVRDFFIDFLEDNEKYNFKSLTNII